MKRWLVALLVLLVSRGKRRPPAPPEPRPDHEAESTVLGLLLLVSIFCVAFAVVYVRGANTQMLGLTLGLAFVCAAAAAIVTARRLVPQDEHVEPRPALDDGEAAGETIERVSAGAAKLSRKRLLLTAATGAGGTVAAALVVPALSLGPNAVRVLSESAWRRGRRLVDEHGRPIPADELAVGSFRTAFPEGADRELLSAPVVVVRIREQELDLPEERRNWAPQGILAFSKICPHAGCAIALFRYPTYEPTTPGPALICPCHYSTFSVAEGGRRTFGPAARPLPQLPLVVDAGGNLAAGGDFSGRVGPSWWKVRQ